MLPYSFGVWLKSAVHMVGDSASSGETDESARKPSVLIVEDEVLNAWHLASVFRSSGFNVVGPARTIEAAAALIEENRPDAAVLDVNIGGKPVFGLARTLTQDNVPVVFATAHAREEDIWPSDLADLPRLQKPFLEDRLVRIVRALTQGEADR